MLKFVFWILLLANAALFSYQQGYFDALLPSGREPARMKNQLNADKIKLMPPPAPAPASPAATPPETQPEKQSEKQSEKQHETPPAAKKEEPVVVACTEIGNFNPEEAKRFSAQLASLSLGDRVSRRTVQEVATHMVYIPPQADKEGVEKKAAELRRLGIEDFFIIQDNSPLRWGISLGVFKTEEAARTHLAALGQKGVRTARIGQRSVNSSLVAFRLRELNAESVTAVEKVRAGFSKQEARECS
jgi:hypothetical protein